MGAGGDRRRSVARAGSSSRRGWRAREPRARAGECGTSRRRGVDVVVDATGFPGSFAQAVEMVRDGGL